MEETKSKDKELLKILGKTGSYEILKELEKESKRFSDLAKIVTHSTLAKRLLELEKFNLIRRKVVDSRPPVVEYVLTEKGRQILKFFKEIVENESSAKK